MPSSPIAWKWCVALSCASVTTTNTHTKTISIGYQTAQLQGSLSLRVLDRYPHIPCLHAPGQQRHPGQLCLSGIRQGPGCVCTPHADHFLSRSCNIRQAGARGHGPLCHAASRGSCRAVERVYRYLGTRGGGVLHLMHYTSPD